MKYTLSGKFQVLSFFIFSFLTTFGADTAQKSPDLGLIPTSTAPIPCRLYHDYDLTHSHDCYNINVPCRSITSSTGLNVLDTLTNPWFVTLEDIENTQQELNNALHNKIVKQGSLEVIFSHDVERTIADHVDATYPEFRNKKIFLIEYGRHGTEVSSNGENYVLLPKSIQENPSYIRVHFCSDPESQRAQEQKKGPSANEGPFSRIYNVLSLRWIFQAIHAISKRLY